MDNKYKFITNLILCLLILLVVTFAVRVESKIDQDIIEQKKTIIELQKANDLLELICKNKL